MIFGLVLILLPAVFSAVSKCFQNQFIEEAFFKQNILGYLPLHEQMKLMLTCRDYYRLLEAEYDQVVKTVTKDTFSYVTAGEALKNDVIRLWKYFKLEMIHRQSNETFTLDTFLLTNEFVYRDTPDSPSFFQNAEVLNAIRSENIRIFDSAFEIIALKKDHPQYFVPHFPEISYILLKSVKNQVDSNEFKLLIENALLASNRFHKFLKFLVTEVFKIRRKNLIDKIATEYASIGIRHNYFVCDRISLIIFIYLQIEASLLTFTFSILAYFLQSYRFSGIEWAIFGISYLVIQSVFNYFMYGNYYDHFVEITSSEMQRLQNFCNAMRFLFRIKENGGTN